MSDDDKEGYGCMTIVVFAFIVACGFAAWAWFLG
jgi:hypothetical protein